MTRIIQTPEQQFYLAKLLGYSYEIIYKTSAQNRVADALSRVHEPTSQLLAITIPHGKFLQQLKSSFELDTQLQELIQKVQEEPEQFPEYTVTNGLLFFKDKLFIPSSSPLKHMLLEEFHSSPLGGHSGFHKTFGRLMENVSWEGMKIDVTQFVGKCQICQQTKHPNHSLYGLLQPLPILRVTGRLR